MAQKALQTDAYLCFDELDRDVRMMCNNCVRYNGSMNEVITTLLRNPWTRCTRHASFLQHNLPQTLSYTFLHHIDISSI